MVVDDHPMWRDAVARDLSEAGFDVVAAVGEGAHALRAAAAVRPDVVVLDLQLPDMPGVELTRGMLATCPQARVLILSASGEQQDVLDAVKAGAAGDIVKSAGAPPGPRPGGGGGGGGGGPSPPPRPARAPGGAAAGPRPPPRARYTQAHRAGGRDPGHGRHRAVLQADRAAAGAVPPHGAEPRPEHAGQAAAAQPWGAHPLRHRARPGRPAGSGFGTRLTRGRPAPRAGAATAPSAPGGARPGPASWPRSGRTSRRCASPSRWPGRCGTRPGAG